ncbi:MAG: winged helix-turn-helix transcriptional regulator [Candidatus Heimdallarchaeota archaeon]|nr:winged helix-turn-helix transcriptional regulator [Candidatus Heimdallarchaeota archaeon]MBY8995096.1 winged helix-turn-helix transcriptional regulator [Candidatus Heimdallarchaeota archaeon]
MTNQNQYRAKVFKALADPLRLEILLFLGENEKCVCEIVEQLDIVQPLISRHLKILRESGLIHGRKMGNKRLYKVAERKVLRMISDLNLDFLSRITERIIQEAI